MTRRALDEQIVVTNGRPGWRDVLTEVRESERRQTKLIEANTTIIRSIDVRTKVLEEEAIERRVQKSTIMSMLGGGRTLMGAALGAVMAILGTGFLGF